MNSSLAQTELSPEIRLLCACCRVRPNDADLQLQAALAPQVDPGMLVQLARRHRVEPLLYHNLKRHQPGVFSADIMDVIAGRVRRNAVKSLHALGINVQIARLMRAAAIPFLPLKGVTLAQRYYGEINLRHAHDIDFWVPPQSVETARALLVKQDCRPDIEHSFQDIEARGVRHRRFLRRYLHHDVLIHPGGEHLELHWRLAHNVKGLRLDPADLLLNGERIETVGDSMTMIGPVPLLLYLCEHGSHHGWYRLKWLMDLPQVLESRDWDWPHVLAEAKFANCLAELLLGLRLAQTLFGWTVPDAVAAAMSKQHFLDWQVKTVCRNLSLPESGLPHNSMLRRMAQLPYRISFITSIGYIGNELGRYLLAPGDLRVIRFPDRWIMIYYCLRPFLWFWRKITMPG